MLLSAVKNAPGLQNTHATVNQRLMTAMNPNKQLRPYLAGDGLVGLLATGGEGTNVRRALDVLDENDESPAELSSKSRLELHVVTVS